MSSQKHCLDDAPTKRTLLGALEAVSPQEATYLGVTRPRQPELPRYRADTSIDLGHRLT